MVVGVLSAMAPLPAAAEPLLRTRVGIGLGSTQHRGKDSLAGPGLVLEVTKPVSPTASVGLHLGLEYGSQYDYDPRAMFTDSKDETFAAVWSGVVLQKEVSPGAFFSPWLGVSTGYEDRCNYHADKVRPANSEFDCPDSGASSLGMAAGLGLAVDLVKASPHRGQGFVQAAVGLGVESFTILFGASYRYSCD